MGKTKQSKPEDKPLTARQVKFVGAWAGDDKAAAKAAGFKHPGVAGCRVANLPHVRAALNAKQAAMIQTTGKQLGKGVTVTRNDIINRLDNISLYAESESAQVAALGHLKDIFGLSPKHANVDLFAGWTDEELDHYRATTELPLRYGP